MLDLRRFRYFLKIVELGSLSRAAAHLNIAQPALSQHVMALEEEFKAQLLLRSPQGVKPTEAGKTLYRHIQSILKLLDQALHDVALSSEALAGTVSIGLPSSTADLLSLPLLQAVRAHYPDLRLQIGSMPSRLLPELVINGRLDLALIFGDRPGKGLSCRGLAVEELFFVGKAVRGRPKGADTIEFAELARHPLVLPCRPHMIREALEAAVAQAGVSLHVLAELDSIPSLVAAAKRGIAATVVPWSATRLAGRGDIVTQHFRKPVTRRISLCLSDSLPATKTTEAVADILVTTMETLVANGSWHGLSLLPADRPHRAALA